MAHAITLFWAILLAGCAHLAPTTPAGPGVGSASYRTAAGTGLAHYQLALGQVATGAALQAHEPPAYPASMLAACPPLVELAARVIVDARGVVGDVRMDPPPAQQPFADAVRRAVRDWRYAPLTISRWSSDADGNSHPVDSETKPFSLDYVFIFRCEHGHTSVSSGPGQGSR
ncbi:MAG TPA: hypothetical protein VGU65_05060 [Frateuria sp.]|uniref:energy transducer TonB n=1 Tax=Frateuria sp. TaxID=2211372 RepID=UPI002DF574DE|nr:hypothetical protein [Frateuria sp.]